MSDLHASAALDAQARVRRRWAAGCAALVALQCLWLVGEAVLTDRWARATLPPVLYSDPALARVTGPDGDLGVTPVCLRLVPGTEVILSRPGYAGTYRVPPGGARHGEVVTLSPVIPVLTPILLRYPLFALSAGVLAALWRRGRREEDDDAVDLRVGGHLGPYALLEGLEHTPLFTRWRARKRGAKLDVTLTVIRAHPLPSTLRRRFEHNTLLLRERPHPNLERVVEAGEQLDTLFVATEPLRGPTLQAWSEAEPRTAVDIVETLVPVLDALAHAHGLGLSHDALDESQVVITTDDGVPHLLGLCLGGFHLATPDDTSATGVTEATEATALQADWRPGAEGDLESDHVPPSPPDLRALGHLMSRLLGGGGPAALQATYRRMQGTDKPAITFRDARLALLAHADEMKE